MYWRRASRKFTAENAENAEKGGRMTINELTDTIIGAAIEVHRRLGPGLLESTYEACLAFELHHAQLLTYLRLSGHRCGLLINFNVRALRAGVRRVVNNLPE
jgi:hypothetical protein